MRIHLIKWSLIRQLLHIAINTIDYSVPIKLNASLLPTSHYMLICHCGQRQVNQRPVWQQETGFPRWFDLNKFY